MPRKNLSKKQEDVIAYAGMKFFDLYQTPQHHADHIFEYYSTTTEGTKYQKTRPLKVLDVCAGFGNLSKPWYDAGHEITMIELNSELIPILEKNFPKAKIININYFEWEHDQEYDIILCNPPFNTDEYTKSHFYFLAKLLFSKPKDTILYFIGPSNFVKSAKEDDYLNFNQIDLNKAMVKRMIDHKLIDKEFILFKLLSFNIDL